LDDSTLAQNQRELSKLKSLHAPGWKQNVTVSHKQGKAYVYGNGFLLRESLPLLEMLSTYLFVLRNILKI
jgi:hypothetical protein